MDCPRCGGAVETYTLGEREASSCDRCGWVGIDAILQDEPTRPENDSWEEVIQQASAGQVRTERSKTMVSPGGAATEPTRSPDVDTGADSSETSEIDQPPEELLAIDAIERSEAVTLEAAGIRSVDGLAAINPIELAGKIGFSADRLRMLKEKAAIQLVTGD
ncbi:MAG: hypothetical protein ABEJ48_03085 [Halobacteriales archaeon]